MNAETDNTRSAGARLRAKQGLLFWRKEAKDFFVAVAVLSGSARQKRKSFLVLFFKKELLAFLLIGSTQMDLA